MFSGLNPKFLYTDVTSDITENDINVVSDLWNIDGRDVYRGSHDTRYSHAHVYWLYDENLQRVGCSEHSPHDHADFRFLWFRESDFGTLFQEDWTVGQDLWSLLPQHVFEKFMNEGWTTPQKFLEQCLSGPMRIVTPSMITNMPNVFTCSVCGRKSLREHSGCKMTAAPLDFPDKSKIFFIDDDIVVHTPPENSRVWTIIPVLHDDDSSQERVQEPQPQAVAALPQSPPQQEPPRQPSPEPVHQSHPQTPAQP
jgi:hypothetical protein